MLRNHSLSFQNIFITPEKYPISIEKSCPFSHLLITDLLSVSVDWPVLDVHRKEIT